MAMREQFIDSNKFLPPQYKPEAYIIRSGYDQETILSAFSFMNGVYPKGFKDTSYSPGLNPVPADQYTRVLNSEYLTKLSSPSTQASLPVFGNEPMMEINDI